MSRRENALRPAGHTNPALQGHFVGDGVLPWSEAEQMPLGYDVPSARQRCHSEPVTVSLAWESVSQRGSAALQGPLCEGAVGAAD